MGASGLLCIVSGPSGAGKTSLCKKLLKKIPTMSFSISYTTRPPRKDEAEGKDYSFVSKEAFRSMIEQEAFAEWAEIYGNLYGTTKACIDRSVEQQVDLLFDIDPQGAQQLKKQYPQAVTIFVLPPSLSELEQRLKERSTDSFEVIENRLKKACQEINRAKDYDYLVTNDDLEKALLVLQSIIIAEKHRSNRSGENLFWQEP